MFFTSGMSSRPTRCGRHFVQAVASIQRPVGKPDVARLPISDLVPFAKVGIESLLQMVAYPDQGLGAVPEVKVANPASYRGVDLIHENCQNAPFCGRG